MKIRVDLLYPRAKSFAVFRVLTALWYQNIASLETAGHH